MALSQTLTLDIARRGTPHVPAKQADHGYDIIITILQDGVNIVDHTTDTASFRLQKADGNAVYGTCTVNNDDTVTLHIDDNGQMLAVAGYASVDVSIEESGDVKSTQNFIFDIQAAPGGSQIPSSTEFTQLQALVTSVNQLNEDAEAYAIGERNGTPVTSGDPAYENNAKYYNTQAQSAALGTVHFDQAQTLTDAQKAQALENVGGASVGDVNDIKSGLLELYSVGIAAEQGYWAVATGDPGSSATWCRSKSYVPYNIEIRSKNSSYSVVLLAYSSNGTYIGGWDGSAFTKTWSSSVRFGAIDVSAVSKAYPNYSFRVDFFKLDQSITPSDVEQNYDILDRSGEKFYISVDIAEVGEMYFFPVKQGDSFTVKSLSGSFNDYRLELYDCDGKYLNYYGLVNGTSSRTITSALDFAYVSITNAPSINASITNHSKLFGASAYADALQAIGQNRADIARQTYRFTKEKAVSESVVRKYGGNNAPVLSDAYFAWISDVHAEVDRMKQFSEMVSDFGNVTIPFVLNTGDTVADVIGDGIAWYDSIVNSMSIPVLNTVGNHDAYTTNGVYASDKTVVYNEIIAPFVSGWGVTQPANASANGYCYYYKDIGAVRLIVLDSAYWDSDQKIWFESVLSDAATNSKHVVVACHAPFSANLCTMVGTAWNTGFLSRDSTIMSAEALTCVQNFKSSGGVFVAWLQGHVHGDEVVTLESGSQLAVCNNSFSNRGTKVYKTSDVANYNYNSCNVVAIDASNNLLKLYRVGANIAVTGKKHNGLVWNYASNTLVAEW